MLGTNINDSRDILLGTGTLKFNGLSVGQLKGDVVFTPEAEYKEFKAGVPQQTIKLLKFSEGAKLKASFAEMSAANFARTLNITESAITYATGTVTAESAVMTGTDTVRLAKGRNISALTVKKGETSAVLDTDYEIVSAERGEIARKTGSTVILDGDTVTVGYSYRESSTINFGGGAQPADVQAEFEYASPDGDIKITITFPKAKWKSGNPITFKEDDFTTNDFEIVAVSDPSKAAGAQLGTVKIEYFPS